MWFLLILIGLHLINVSYFETYKKHWAVKLSRDPSLLSVLSLVLCGHPGVNASLGVNGVARAVSGGVSDGRRLPLA